MAKYVNTFFYIGLLSFFDIIIQSLDFVIVTDSSYEEKTCVPTYGYWSIFGKEYSNCILADKVSPFNEDV